MSVPFLYEGDEGPYVLTLSAIAPVDFSLVTDAELRVKRPDGVIVTWAAAISELTATSLKLSHQILTSESAYVGDHLVVARLIRSAGAPLRSDVRVLRIKNYFQKE